MAQYNFGVGSLTANPPAGSSDLTPIQVGVLKDVSVEVSFSLKELIGAYGFPVDVARGPGKIMGKAKFAQIRGGLIASILAGSTITQNSSTLIVVNEAGTVAAGAVTVAGAANFADDLGVVDANGVPYTKVTAGPTGTQYTVTAGGVYGFNASENAKVLYFTYTKTQTSGKKIVYNNQLMGGNVAYAVTLFNVFRGNTYGVKFFAAAIPKLNFGFKNEDYTDQDMEFNVFADSTGKVCEFYTAE